jgi:tRNA-dihydrouridine synthase A
MARLRLVADCVAAISDAGSRTVIVHARKAILRGVSPKQNRMVPPLDYPCVWRVKREFPLLTVVLNGGLRPVRGRESGQPDARAHAECVARDFETKN